MPKSYCHLRDLEQTQIQAHLDLSRKVRAIFRTFLCSPSPISRELQMRLARPDRAYTAVLSARS